MASPRNQYEVELWELAARSVVPSELAKGYGEFKATVLKLDGIAQELVRSGQANESPWTFQLIAFAELRNGIYVTTTTMEDALKKGPALRVYDTLQCRTLVRLYGQLVSALRVPTDQSLNPETNPLRMAYRALNHDSALTPYEDYAERLSKLFGSSVSFVWDGHSDSYVIQPDSAISWASPSEPILAPVAAAAAPAAAATPETLEQVEERIRKELLAKYQTPVYAQQVDRQGNSMDSAYARSQRKIRALARIGRRLHGPDAKEQEVRFDHATPRGKLDFGVGADGSVVARPAIRRQKPPPPPPPPLPATAAKEVIVWDDDDEEGIEDGGWV